jgi:hypothetical protein
MQIRTLEISLNIKTTLTVLLSALNPAEQKVATYLTWEIWKARNSFIFENQTPNPQQIVQVAFSMSQLKHAQRIACTSSNPHTIQTNITNQSTKNLAFAEVDASLDQAGKAGVGVTLYTASGSLQLVFFAPIVAQTPFQAEAKALHLALEGLSSPFLQKPQRFVIDCKQLVDFLQKEGNEDVPCWQGAREAYSCLDVLR